MRREAFADKELNTVYIGGGTPTTLEPVQLSRLLTKAGGTFCLQQAQRVYGGSWTSG